MFSSFSSDKSDSSDLDSVHSLPVTSNSSKHNSSKTASSSSSAPQASYADIARMATLNMSTNPVLNISNLMPSMINTTAWPTVASTKLSTETDKLPNDYYPSLDELHTDRKTRQHNFVQQGASHSLDKPPSPTMSKTKSNESSSKKIEAQEEAISKVVKYVQDIEKMQQNQSSSSQQDSSGIKQSSNNSSPVSNETTPTNPPLPSKLPEPTSSYTAPPPETAESSSNNNGDNNSGKDFAAAGSKSSGPRVRKSHMPNPVPVQNPRDFTPTSIQPPVQADETRESNKKVQSSQSDEPPTTKSSSSSNPSTQSQSDDKDGKKVSGVHNLTAGPSDTVDSSKTRIPNSVVKSAPQSRPVETEAIRVHKERILKNPKEPQQIHPKDNPKVSFVKQKMLISVKKEFF